MSATQLPLDAMLAPLSASWYVAFEASAIWMLRCVGLAVLSGSLLAIVTWLLLSSAFRRARPALHAFFWLVVLAKFLVPYAPGVPYSFSTLISQTLGVPNTLSTSVAPTPAAIIEPAAHGSTWVFYTMQIDDGATAAAAATRPPPRHNAPLPWATLFCAAYLGGLLIVAWVRIAAYVRFARISRRLPLADEATAQIVANCCKRCGVRAAPSVRISEQSLAPYVFGGLRPVLVLSKNNLDRADELEAVVLHEIAHLRRGDLFVRYVQWLAGTMLYFWPIVAWVNRRIDLARETACDEWALRHGRLSPAAYARCLLKCVRPARPRWAAFSPAAMAANSSHVERRIDMILNSNQSLQQRRAFTLLGGAALAGWTGFVLSGSAAALPTKPTLQSAVKKAAKSDADKGATNAALDFFLPQVSAAISDTAEPAQGAWSTNGGQPAMIMMMRRADDAAGGVWQRHQVALNADDASGNGIFEIKLNAVAGEEATHTLAFAPAGQFVVQGMNIGNTQMDLDGDGQIAPEEHSAYLAALAMQDPAAVLAKFPKSDLNADGVLDASEASQLTADSFGGDMPEPQIMMFHSSDDALPAGIAEKLQNLHIQLALPDSAAADGTTDVVKRIVRVTNDNGKITEETQENDGPVTVRVRTADDAGAQQAPVAGQLPLLSHVFRANAIAGDGAWEVAGSPLEGCEPPAVWLLSNIKSQPNAEQVAKLLKPASDASLAAFLKKHPKADRNEDGVLTAEERAAYIERRQSSHRARILERHPEADADGDGLLTNDEMKKFFRSKARPGSASDASAESEDVQVIGGPAGRQMRVKTVRGADGQLKVEVTHDGESESAPR